jgi:hypothetical protein
MERADAGRAALDMEGDDDIIVDDVDDDDDDDEAFVIALPGRFVVR